MALLKINNTDLPTPTVLQPGIQDLDSEDGTGRNQAGEMFRDRIAVKRTVHCEWGVLSRTEMSSLLSLMSDVSFSLTYPDPLTGNMKTITAYVGDRTPAMCTVIETTSSGVTDFQWNNLSVDFVEM